MLIRAIQVRRFVDPCAEALVMASRRMRCGVNELAVELLADGDLEVTRVCDTRVEFWIRHKATGKYLTTLGLRASLELNGGRIAGYKTVRCAKIALREQSRILGIAWDDVETVTL